MRMTIHCQKKKSREIHNGQNNCRSSSPPSLPLPFCLSSPSSLINSNAPRLPQPPRLCCRSSLSLISASHLPHLSSIQTPLVSHSSLVSHTHREIADHPSPSSLPLISLISHLCKRPSSPTAPSSPTHTEKLQIILLPHLCLSSPSLPLGSTKTNTKNQSLKCRKPDAAATRSQLQPDVSLVRENEALRSELMKMKLYVSDMQKNQVSSTKGIVAAAPTATGSRKHTFFSSMSKTLGKLNLFKHGSEDTFHIDDNIGVDITKPRRRRFSIS